MKLLAVILLTYVYYTVVSESDGDMYTYNFAPKQYPFVDYSDELDGFLLDWQREF